MDRFIKLGVAVINLDELQALRLLGSESEMLVVAVIKGQEVSVPLTFEVCPLSVAKDKMAEFYSQLQDIG